MSPDPGRQTESLKDLARRLGLLLQLGVATGASLADRKLAKAIARILAVSAATQSESGAKQTAETELTGTEMARRLQLALGVVSRENEKDKPG